MCVQARCQRGLEGTDDPGQRPKVASTQKCMTKCGRAVLPSANGACVVCAL